MSFIDDRHCHYSFVQCQIATQKSRTSWERVDMNDGWDGRRNSKLILWLARYRALETIAERKGDHLLRDAGLSREEARAGLTLPAIAEALLQQGQPQKGGPQSARLFHPRTGRMKLRS
jgi:hypothetical protein